MTTISSVSSAWSSASVQRASRPAPTPERLLSKIDTDGNGGVSDTELQGLLDDVAKKSGVSSQTSAADLVKQYDSNGDGNLNADELGKTMQSVLPPPPSTMAFAQSRGDSDTATGQAGDDLFGKVDSDGDGSVGGFWSPAAVSNTVSKTELQALLEAMSGGTASQAGVSSDDVFSQLDADGDGSLTQAEFDAGRPSGAAGEAGRGMQAMGGMPPPPGGPDGASASANSTTTYDALDTNKDGEVSLTERLAGSPSSVEQDAITALFNAIDTDGDASISASESRTFIEQLTSQLQQPPSQASTSDTSQRNDLARLADFARQQYAMAANDWNSPASTGSLSAMA